MHTQHTAQVSQSHAGHSLTADCASGVIAVGSESESESDARRVHYSTQVQRAADCRTGDLRALIIFSLGWEIFNHI